MLDQSTRRAHVASSEELFDLPTRLELRLFGQSIGAQEIVYQICCVLGIQTAQRLKVTIRRDIRVVIHGAASRTAN